MQIYKESNYLQKGRERVKIGRENPWYDIFLLLWPFPKWLKGLCIYWFEFWKLNNDSEMEIWKRKLVCLRKLISVTSSAAKKYCLLNRLLYRAWKKKPWYNMNMKTFKIRSKNGFDCSLKSLHFKGSQGF